MNGNNLNSYFPYEHHFLGVDTIYLNAYPTSVKYKFEGYVADSVEFFQDPQFAINQAILTTNDTIYALFSKDHFSFYLPNSFSPNGDGDNDIWRPVGNAIDVSEYLLEIYDRSGSLIFRTKDFYEGWNGSVNNGDYYVTSGVYIFRMYYKSAVSVEFEEVSGTITVVR